jgi:hypothetical protein
MGFFHTQVRGQTLTQCDNPKNHQLLYFHTTTSNQQTNSNVARCGYAFCSVGVICVLSSMHGSPRFLWGFVCCMDRWMDGFCVSKSIKRLVLCVKNQKKM